jgi:hypothetical protein
MEDYTYSRDHRSIERFHRFSRKSRKTGYLFAKVNCINGRHMLMLRDGAITTLFHPRDPEHELSREGVETMQILAQATGGEPLRCRCFEAQTAWRWFTSEYVDGAPYYNLLEKHSWLKPALYNRITESCDITPTHMLSLIPKAFHDAAREARDRSVYRNKLALTPWHVRFEEKNRIKPAAERYKNPWDRRRILGERVNQALLRATNHGPDDRGALLPQPQAAYGEWLRRVLLAPWFRTFSNAGFAPVQYPLRKHWAEHNGVRYPEYGVCFTLDSDARTTSKRYPTFWFSLEPDGGSWKARLTPVKEETNESEAIQLPLNPANKED